MNANVTFNRGGFGTIIIAMGDGVTREVYGQHIGAFLVHRKVDDQETWSITHIRSGVALCHGEPYQRVVALARQLRKHCDAEALDTTDPARVFEATKLAMAEVTGRMPRFGLRAGGIAVDSRAFMETFGGVT